jgi:hypothetical protein
MQMQMQSPKRNSVAVLVMPVVVIIIMIALSGCIGSADSVTGRYYDETAPSHYVDLKSTGEYFVYQEPDAVSFDGRYRVENGAVFLIVPFGSIRMDIVDSRTLKDTNGDLWKKN